MPDEREVRGLLALLLLTDARRATRTDAGRAGCCCSRSRTARSGTGPRSPRAARWCSARCAAAGPGRFALQAAIAAAARRGADLRGHRLAAGAGASTTSCCGSGRRRWWRSTGRWRCPMVDGPEAALAELDAARARRPAGRLPLPARHQGRPAAPARPPGRGGGRLPGRARAGRQRGRARLPGPPPRRGQRLGLPHDGQQAPLAEGRGAVFLTSDEARRRSAEGARREGAPSSGPQ